MTKNHLIIVRGAGDLATGTIHRLKSAGFSVLALETERPAAIRRTVSFCEAVYQGSATVEGITAIQIEEVEAANRVEAEKSFPILIDPEGACISQLKPAVVVDAILAKKNLGTYKEMAPLTIALGPGFLAGEDVDYVIETMRGHDLGRVISDGSAQPNTGIPGILGGYGAERVIHAPHAGRMNCHKSIGDIVQKGEVIAEIEEEDGCFPVYATIPGLLRGIIRDGYVVPKGFKIADIDPRCEEGCRDRCFTISDKARCISGSVLELVCHSLLGRGGRQV